MDSSRAPFVAPPELLRLLANPGILKHNVAQRARTLYHDNSSNFEPFRDLSRFGAYCFMGAYENLGQEYTNSKPDLQGTETAYKWGYITLAAAGSRHVRYVNKPADSSPHAAIIRFLLTRGAPVNLPDIAGLTALHHVAMNNRVGEVLKLLLESGADPNQQDRYGATPLYSAVLERQPEAAEMCLEFGADPNIQDGDGFSSFDTARYSTPAISALLHKYQRQKDGVQVPMEDKGKCAACGKSGSKLQCSRCRVVRYCDAECQHLHWKNEHKTNCIPFGDKPATLVCKPTYYARGDGSSRYNAADLVHNIIGSGLQDGEGRRAQDAKMGMPHPQNDFAKPKASKEPPSQFSPFKSSTIGKSMIIKAQVPVGTTIGTGTTVKDASHEGQPDVYAKLKTVIKQKGALGGLKAYFVAELESKDSLRIKIGDILADQPW